MEPMLAPCERPLWCVGPSVIAIVVMSADARLQGHVRLVRTSLSLEETGVGGRGLLRAEVNFLGFRMAAGMQKG